jgi:hypothetical protein
MDHRQPAPTCRPFGQPSPPAPPFPRRLRLRSRPGNVGRRRAAHRPPEEGNRRVVPLQRPRRRDPLRRQRQPPPLPPAPSSLIPTHVIELNV